MIISLESLQFFNEIPGPPTYVDITAAISISFISNTMPEPGAATALIAGLGLLQRRRR